MILKKWIIGSIRANESEIAEGIKERYFRKWLSRYQVRAHTGLSKAESLHKKSIVTKAFNKLLANCEQRQLEKVAD